MSASIGLLIIVLPIVAFILIFGELMAVRKRQKKMLELLKLLAQSRGVDTRQLDDDDT